MIPILILTAALVTSAHCQSSWQAQYYGGGQDDEAVKILVDGANKEHVLLRSEVGSAGDVLIHHLGSSGSIQRTIRYDTGGDDYPRDFTLSGSANVVLTDVFNGSDWDVDLRMVDQYGTVLWNHTISSAGDDFAGAVIRNANGDIYAAIAYHNGTNHDWLVVRYDSLGVAQSAQTLDYGSNDVPTAIAADSLGNVYVAGSSDDGAGSGGINARVVKFDDTGSVVWSTPYDGGVGTDLSNELVCDTGGNSFLIGTAATAAGQDILVLRILSTGIVDWNFRINGSGPGANLPGDIAIDPAGGCVVCGSVFNGTDHDLVTTALDSSGSQTWTNPGPATSDNDHAAGIAVDANGDTCVVGHTQTSAGNILHVLYFDNTGSQTWSDSGTPLADLSAVDVVFRFSGTPILIGHNFAFGAKDGFVIGYQVGGTIDFNTVIPPRLRGRIFASVVNSSGDVYIVGQEEGASNAISATVIKYDTSGQQLWVRRYAETFPSKTSWTDAVIDAGGNLCLVGRSFTTKWRSLTAQYSPTGDLNWLDTYSSPEGEGVDIETDPMGNLYTLVWGRTTTSSSSDRDCILIKFDNAGNRLWTYSYDTGEEEEPYDLAVDSAGNSHLAGSVDTNSAAAGYINFVAIKVDTTGIEQWVATRDFGGQDVATAIALDGSGNVYVSGPAGYPVSCATASYDSAGVFRWEDAVPLTKPGAPAFLVFNGTGEVCVSTTTGGDDLLLLRYSSGGVLAGTTPLDVDGGEDTALDMRLDSQNRIYILAEAFRTGSAVDAYVARFSAAGVFEWGDGATGPNAFPDIACALSIDNNDQPYLVSQLNDNPGKSTVTQKLDPGQNPTDIALSNSSVLENSGAGTTVGTLTTTDPTPADIHTYSLVVGAGDTDNGEFAIVNDELRLAAAPDYESGNTRSIRVRTTDQTALTYEEIFTIFIGDLNEAPFDISLSPAAIDENQPAGTPIGVFMSSDQDALDSHTYSLVSGAGDADNSLFQITAGQLELVVPLDFETGATRSIRVRSQDSGSLTFEKALTIQINDVNDPPTGVALSSTDVQEQQPVGTLVGDLSPSDQDIFDSHTYSLVSGVGDSGNGSFTVVGGELRTAAVFDSSVQASYSIRIQVADAASSTFEQVFTINVTMFEPPTDLILSSSAIDENLAAGTTVGAFAVTDPSTADSHTFSLVAGPGDTDNAAFAVSSDQLLTAVVFDFESRNSLSLRVRVTDSTALTYEEVFIVTVNDLPEGGGGSTESGDKDGSDDESCSANGTSSPRMCLLLLLLLAIGAWRWNLATRPDDLRFLGRAPTT